MSLLNKAAVKRSALGMASARFKERNKTRVEMGLTPLKAPPSRVGGDFFNAFEARVITMLASMVSDHKKGLTL